MYAFVPGKFLCLVYEDFYLAISNTFYEFINLLCPMRDIQKNIVAGYIPERSMLLFVQGLVIIAEYVFFNFAGGCQG